MALRLLNQASDTPVTLTCLTTDDKPTSYSYGSRLFVADISKMVGTWWVYTPSGWIREDQSPITIGTNAALVAGDANIGNVDIVTMPNVTIGTNAALVAGEAHIGEVGLWSDLITVTPAIAAAAFTANDFVGGKLTLANAVRVATGKGAITGLKIVDVAKQNAALLVFLFKADLAGTYADNAAESVSAADWLNWIGTVEIQASDWQEMANASLADLGFEIPIEAAAGRSIYALIVTTDTPTYTENCLQLTFGVRE